jgi:hypothetical protein
MFRGGIGRKLNLNVKNIFAGSHTEHQIPVELLSGFLFMSFQSHQIDYTKKNCVSEKSVPVITTAISKECA